MYVQLPWLGFAANSRAIAAARILCLELGWAALTAALSSEDNNDAAAISFRFILVNLILKEKESEKKMFFEEL